MDDGTTNTMLNTRLILFAGLAITLALGSCASSPEVNYYLLTANSKDNLGSSNPANNISVSLGVGPITVPEYLQRSQIVYSMDGNNLTIAQQDFWSEPLDSAISRVVAYNLMRLNKNSSIVTFPWRGDQSPHYAIRISIIELNRSSTNIAHLEAEWTLLDQQSKSILGNQIFSATVEMSEFSYLALAGAYSELLAVLSENISAAVNTLAE